MSHPSFLSKRVQLPFLVQDKSTVLATFDKASSILCSKKIDLNQRAYFFKGLTLKLSIRHFQFLPSSLPLIQNNSKLPIGAHSPTKYLTSFSHNRRVAHTQTNCEYISEGNSFGSTDIFVLGCHKAVILVETESKAVIVDVYES